MTEAIIQRARKILRLLESSPDSHLLAGLDDVADPLVEQLTAGDENEDTTNI